MSKEITKCPHCGKGLTEEEVVKIAQDKAQEVIKKMRKESNKGWNREGRPDIPIQM